MKHGHNAQYVIYCHYSQSKQYPKALRGNGFDQARPHFMTWHADTHYASWQISVINDVDYVGQSPQPYQYYY